MVEETALAVVPLPPEKPGPAGAVPGARAAGAGGGGVHPHYGRGYGYHGGLSPAGQAPPGSENRAGVGRGRGQRSSTSRHDQVRTGEGPEERHISA